MSFTLKDIKGAVVGKEVFAHPAVVDVSQHAYKNGFNKAIDAQSSVRLRLNREKLAGLMYYFLDTDFYGTSPVYGMTEFMRIKDNAFCNPDSPWFNRKHMGDCTKEPNTCMTCQVEECERQADSIIAAELEILEVDNG